MLERIEQIESDILELDQGLSDARVKLHDQANELKARIDAETHLREAADNVILEKLRDAALHRFSFLAFGAFWVLIGTILSTLSPEIVRIAAGQWRSVFTAL